MPLWPSIMESKKEKKVLIKFQDQLHLEELLNTMNLVLLIDIWHVREINVKILVFWLRDAYNFMVMSIKANAFSVLSA